MIKTILLSTTQFEGTINIWGMTAPNSPVFAGLGRTVSRKSSTGAFIYYAGRGRFTV